jgi:AraC-like DNA-binding protein
MQSEYAKAFDYFQHGVLKNLLYSFLLMAERERRQQDFQEIKPSSDLNYLLAFKDILEIHFKTQKFVYFYAQQIGITPKRLGQATSEILSKSPKQIIDERVILEAKRLLVHTSISIKEIADQIGFDEPTNFNKFFRNNTNCTPLQFRESNT